MARVKGAAIVDSVRYLRRHKDEARALLAPELHHYLAERVLIAGWYPEEDLVPLVRAMATIQGEHEASFFDKAGRLAAYTHAQGVYRMLLRDGARESLARRAFILWTSQHDTGTMEMHVTESPNRVSVSVRGFGAPSREFCQINGGYIAATFEITGCQQVKAAKESCCVDGDLECTWQVSWDHKP
jgi:hypothetical protein